MKTTFALAFDMSRDICALHVFLNLMGFENEEVEFSSDFPPRKSQNIKFLALAIPHN